MLLKESGTRTKGMLQVVFYIQGAWILQTVGTVLFSIFRSGLTYGEGLYPTSEKLDLFWVPSGKLKF